MPAACLCARGGYGGPPGRRAPSAAGYQHLRATPGCSGGAPLRPGAAPAGPGDTLGRSPTHLEPELLALFTTFVTDEIAAYGYLAIFLLMVLESACVPIPSEVTMLFGGALITAPFLAADQHLDLWLVVLAGTGGNLVGSWLAYWAGYVGGRPFVARWGRYLLIRPHEVDRAHDWFERYGQATVFFGRLLPVIRTFISLPAGVVRMDLRRFTLYTVLGCLPWSLLLTWLGYKLGERWDEVERFIRPFSWAIVVAVVVGVSWFVWHRLRAIRVEEAERPTPAEPARSKETSR